MKRIMMMLTMLLTLENKSDTINRVGKNCDSKPNLTNFQNAKKRVPVKEIVKGTLTTEFITQHRQALPFGSVFLVLLL
jgi:hypothetical protein